jgi:hypothetical protein
MKKLAILFLVAFTVTAFSQYKDSGFPENDVKDGIVSHSGNSNSLFGFLNSDNFSMHHSFSLSYSSFGNGEGLSLGVYTNSMMYKFANNLNVQLDASFVTSPYSSFGKDFQNNLNGIYISKAAINYKPWKDFSISVQYRNLPYSYYNPYSPYSNYYGYGLFNQFDDNGFQDR